MNTNNTKQSQGRRTASLLLFLGLAPQVLCADPAAGKVVWWGSDVFQRGTYSEHTNGVVESENEVLGNVVAIAGGPLQGLALQSDSTVAAFGFGGDDWNAVPSGLSNVVSVAVAGNSCWAIRRDGTVARWGNNDKDEANIVAGLSNVKAIAWAGYRSYLALMEDGTVSGFRLQGSGSTNGPAAEPAIRTVRVGGRVLSNVVALTSSYEPLVLKKDGRVFRLAYWTPGKPRPEPVATRVDDSSFTVDFGGEFWKTPYDYTSADPVLIRGQPLSKVIAIAEGGPQILALKSDGTVVAWGTNYPGETTIPEGLNHVTAQL